MAIGRCIYQLGALLSRKGVTSLALVGIFTLEVLSLHAQTPPVLAHTRDGASAILLRDGRVLIAGGQTAGGAVASAEVFDGTGSFVPVAAMNVARSDYAAATLPDGTILVAGGNSTDGAPTATAEIFDPTANTWTLVASMTDARQGHSACALKEAHNGGVVIVGGNEEGETSSIEIFDPVTRTFSPVGSLAAGRTGHAAVALENDRVLVAGGMVDGAAVASTEVFDASTGAVTPGPDLYVARGHCSATVLLDGKVLIAGGRNEAGDLGSAEIYDPVTNGVTLSASTMLSPRSDHLALRLPRNNSVLFLGGSSAGMALDSCELYVPWTDSFRPSTPLIDARIQAAGAPLDIAGLMLVAGGKGVVTAEIYGFPTLSTDKDDYPPFSEVYITGTGFGPNETVASQVVEIVGQNAGTAYEPWDTIADDQGSFLTSWLIFSEEFLGATLELTSTGTSTGVTARTRFTDANAKIDILPNGVSANVALVKFSDTDDCTGTGGTEFNNGNSAHAVGEDESLQATANAFSNDSRAFVGWTGPAGTFSTLAAPRTICIHGVQGGGNRQYFAQYAANISTQLSLQNPTPASVIYHSNGLITLSAILTRAGGTVTPPISGAPINFYLSALGSEPEVLIGTGITNGSGTVTTSFNPDNLEVSESPYAVVARYAGTTGFEPTVSNLQNLVITPRALNVTAAGIDKVYDGTATAQVNLATDKVIGDDVTASYAAAVFNDKNIGNDKPVSVTGIAIAGADAANYALQNTTAASTADITPKALTVTADAKN